MNEFIKPKRKLINPIPYIQKITGEGLIKDLYDNEVVCETCSGSGIIISNNVYGLSEEPDRKAGMFPYNHQSYKFCPDCYNGVVHKCKLCGKIIKLKQNSKCDCVKQQELDEKERERKWQEEWDKAPELPEELKEKYQFFYSEFYGYNNGYFDDWDSFFDYWNDNWKDECERPEYVWVTNSVSMKIDAMDIIERATEDLYEDAINDILKEDISYLQKFLDNWCKECGVGETYYESHEYKVRIPWKEYN